MKPVEIKSMSVALFSNIPYYLEYVTGRTMHGILIQRNLQSNPEQYMLLPNLCIAHTEQIYLQKKYGDTARYKKYGLDTYPPFPLLLTDDLRNLAGKYSQTAHIFFMDWLDNPHADEDYKAYMRGREEIMIDLAKKWCSENGIEYVILPEEERARFAMDRYKQLCKEHGIEPQSFEEGKE